MSLARAIASYLWEMAALFWFLVAGPPVNDPDTIDVAPVPRAASDVNVKVDVMSAISLEPWSAEMHCVDAQPQRSQLGQEAEVSDSFLSQLEQRTQQVKITLANLDAEKTRIEGLITQLQPLVPHYDALLEAERTIEGARITLEEAAERDQPAAPSWMEQHGQREAQAENAWS